MKDKHKIFRLDMMREVNGCSPAMRHLRDKYGKDAEWDLSKNRGEILRLLDEDGKADWVIHFCLNLLEYEEQCFFLQYNLLNLSNEFPEDKNFSKISGLIVDQICKGINHDSELDAHYSNIEKSLSELENRYSEDEIESTILERLTKIYRLKALQTILHNMDNNLVKACRLSCLHAVDSIVSKEMLEGGDKIISIARKSKLREYALYAMKLTKIWPDD